MMTSIRNYRNAYLTGLAGATAIVFALIIPMVVASAAFGVDLAFAYLVRQRLSHALDAAAVAAAAASNEGGNLQAKVEEFLAKNYPSNKIGDVYNLSITQNGSKIRVSANARFDAYFGRLLGKDEIDVYAETEVTREILGLEVALVLDVTGSMDRIPPAPPGSPANEIKNIDALKGASTLFTDILFRSAVFDDTIKIGIVPYATTVNVGPYGLGLTPDGEEYGTPFVNNPDGVDYYNPAPSNKCDSRFREWQGCVLAREYPDDTTDAEDWWRWEMWRMTFEHSSSYSIRNDYVRRYYSCENREITERRWSALDKYYGPNYNCPKASILPLTSNEDDILAKINSFEADGNTSGNIGMVWGYRVISPEFPFQEGADYGDRNWKKAVVMMTDGDNTVDSYYTPHGGYTQSDVTSRAEMNTRFEETCEAMKEAGILVYTITFSYPTNYDDEGNASSYNINGTTRGYYERCATENKYYDALGQDELRDVFEAISRELSNIHISG